MPTLRDMGKYNTSLDSYYGNTLYYKNPDAIEKVIRYISRTRWNEDRKKDLVCIGGAGIDINAPVEIIIQQLMDIQKFYNINSRKGRRLVHLVYSFSDEDFYALDRNYALVNLVARYISAYFFNRGFQVFYGIHDDEQKHVHIHFAISSINYINGKKYHAAGESFKEMIRIFDSIYHQICSKTNNY